LLKKGTSQKAVERLIKISVARKISMEKKAGFIIEGEIFIGSPSSVTKGGKSKDSRSEKMLDRRGNVFQVSAP